MLPLAGFTNCGRKTMKNNSGFGLSRLFNATRLKIRQVVDLPSGTTVATLRCLTASTASHSK